jgi:hypothetical protein
MPDKNGFGRRKVLKTSGASLAGGTALASMASEARAEENYDLSEDFQELNRYMGKSTKDDAYIDVDMMVYRPKKDTDLARERVRVCRAVIEIDAEPDEDDGPAHERADIKFNGYNDAVLLEEDDSNVHAIGPNSTIGSESYTIGFSATSGGSASAGTDTSVSVSASSTVSYSKSESESNFEISNYSQTGEERFFNRYEFKNDLQREYVAFDGTAGYDCLYVDEPEECIDLNWEVETSASTSSGSMTYSHREGDMD